MPKILQRSVTLTLGVSGAAKLALSALLVGLQVANEIALKGHGQIQAVVAVGIAFVAVEVVTPITGDAFRKALGLPDWADRLLSAIAIAGTGALQIAGLSYALHIVLISALTFLASLGFGPAPPPAAVAGDSPAPPPASRRAPHQK